MIRLLRFAFRSVKLHWRQSLAALIAIASGFVSLCLFQGYMDDVQSIYETANVGRAMRGHVLIEIDGEALIDEPAQTRISSILKDDDRVEVAVRFLDLSGQITNGRNSMIFMGYGYDAEEGARMRGPVWSWNTLAGHPLRAEDGADAAVLGRGLLTILDCPLQLPKDFVNGLGGFDPVERPLACPFQTVQMSLMTSKGQMNGIDFRVTGATDMVYKEVDERFVSLPLPAAQALLDTKGVTRFAVLLKDGDDAFAVVDDLNRHFRGDGLPVKAVRWQDHKFGDLYNQTMDLLSIFRNFVVTVILIISCLSVFNTFIRNVSERTREIGTLRSLGFRSRHVLALFLGEAFFLALLGCAIGTAISLGAEVAINAAGITYKPGLFSTPVPFRIAAGPLLIARTAAFLCALVAFTSWFSVRGAIRRKIVENLGHA